MMDKVKPYMFWVICAVLLLVEIGIAASLEPSNGKGKNALTAATALNTEVGSLADGYGAKVDNDPPASFEIDDVAYFNKLRAEYLVTDKWEPALSNVKADLDSHKANVEKDLHERSAVLHKPFKPNASLPAWYFAYEALTAQYVKDLYQSNLLALDGDPVARVEEEADKDDVYKGNKRIREILGFYTKVQDFPNQGEQGNIALRLYITEAVIRALQESEALLLANNLVNTEDESFILAPDEPVKAQLKKIDWDVPAQNWTDVKQVAIKGGRALPFKLVLRGSAGAILAATAKIEENGQPVFVVHGCEWKKSRRGGKGPRGVVEKKVDSTVEVTLSIAVLDYQGAE